MMRLALTLGDPRGIGPEIVAKALSDPRIAVLGASWHLIGPTGTEVPVHEPIGVWAPIGQRDVDIAQAGQLAGLAVDRAARMALAGEVDGIVTAPLDKAALQAGGFDFPGHTEMLADIAGVPATMMLASDRLRVVLATTHLALRDVPAAVTREALLQAIHATREGLRADFGIAEPRLALCALNPHAGDSGRFGCEDDELLAPVAREVGIAGPFPADTVFVRAMRGEFDAVIAPYHDVGMTAIKVASFGSAVNVTLGLPFVRTSPDHGTALDIAGQGIASAESLVAAMRLAVELVGRRRAG
ncbi:4-hydroxythreonine-4-phosphate dehydrogenase PdxA [Gemmatimonas sp.]|uniref:4-hydroxythreonine-4-phosphate dehydrogenase PdxA n=1 Tax=Gemmatimonas sp. TaxID=1962908 RepID=UPI0039836024